jgi:hypothetical protein
MAFSQVPAVIRVPTFELETSEPLAAAEIRIASGLDSCRLLPRPWSIDLAPLLGRPLAVQARRPTWIRAQAGRPVLRLGWN